MEWLLDIPLIVLLTITLFHAVRLERALGVLRHDRAALQTLVDGFNASSQVAELSIGQVRAAADGAGRLLTRHIEAAKAKQDELTFVMERADALADRLEALVRGGRSLAQTATAEPPSIATPVRPRSQAEQDLMRALNLAR